MSQKAVRAIRRLGAPPWETADPFLFCVHHDDRYPEGNDAMGPSASLAGRRIGQDFEGKDGWRMYHGEIVPGFPHHPHRGFETVTIVRRGFIDHTDSLGAAARYGNGDVQWLTAGRGVNHAEMFPLLEQGRPNPLELFQIWLNLPRASKFAEPHFTMFWADRIPRSVVTDDAGRTTTVDVIAGRLDGAEPLAPPPESWASNPESDIAIWTIRMQPDAHWTLPAAHAGTNRVLYFFRGDSLTIDGDEARAASAVELRPDIEATIENGGHEAELLLLQGRPIGEPVAQYGPFVMNTRDEIQQAFIDYQQTHFGGWPWPSDDPVHPRDVGRFARHADGRIEKPVE
jgi:redox-sensitive bicupin YhaK (pirin superfamily)